MRNKIQKFLEYALVVFIYFLYYIYGIDNIKRLGKKMENVK